MFLDGDVQKETLPLGWMVRMIEAKEALEPVMLMVEDDECRRKSFEITIEAAVTNNLQIINYIQAFPRFIKLLMKGKLSLSRPNGLPNSDVEANTLATIFYTRPSSVSLLVSSTLSRRLQPRQCWSWELMRQWSSYDWFLLSDIVLGKCRTPCMDHSTHFTGVWPIPELRTNLLNEYKAKYWQLNQAPPSWIEYHSQLMYDGVLTLLDCENCNKSFPTNTAALEHEERCGTSRAHAEEVAQAGDASSPCCSLWSDYLSYRVGTKHERRDGELDIQIVKKCQRVIEIQQIIKLATYWTNSLTKGMCVNWLVNPDKVQCTTMLR